MKVFIPIKGPRGAYVHTCIKHYANLYDPTYKVYLVLRRVARDGIHKHVNMKVYEPLRIIQHPHTLPLHIFSSKIVC